MSHLILHYNIDEILSTGGKKSTKIATVEPKGCFLSQSLERIFTRDPRAFYWQLRPSRDKTAPWKRFAVVAN